MRRIRRITALVLMGSLCAICLGACGKKNQKQQIEPTPTAAGILPGMNNEPGGTGTTSLTGAKIAVSGESAEGVIFYLDGGTYTEKYALYTPEGTSQPLHILNVESGQSSIFCFDPGCEHKKTKMSLDGTEVLEKGCPAYEYGPVYITGDTLYCFSNGSLWSGDVTGNNRKEITKLGLPIYYGANFLFTDKAMYVSYVSHNEWVFREETSEWVAGMPKERQEAGLVRIPYSGEGAEIIFRSDEYYEMQVKQLYYHDGCICFMVGGKDAKDTGVVPDYSQPAEVWQAQIEELMQHEVNSYYDYVTATGEVKLLFTEKPAKGAYLFRNVYGNIQKFGTPGPLELHKYSGEKTADTEVQFYGYNCDHGIIGMNEETQHGVMLSEETGKVIKTSPFTWEDFTVEVVVGETFYGRVGFERAYISAEDYWAGNKDGIIRY